MVKEKERLDASRRKRRDKGLHNTRLRDDCVVFLLVDKHKVNLIDN